MTTTFNRYSQGKIYKLIDYTTGMFYIGSTALNRLDQRYHMHKNASKCSNYKNNNTYKHLTYEKFISGVINIVQLADVNASSKRELEKEENAYICKEIQNPLCLNTNRAYISEEQIKEENKKYHEENKERIKEHKHAYYLQNKEHIKEYAKQNKDHISKYMEQYNKEYREKNKDKLKEQKNQYRIDNSEIIKQRKTQYYLQNKDKINEKLKEKCTCICGISLRKSDLRRHEQSQKHINFIKIQNENSVNTIE